MASFSENRGFEANVIVSVHTGWDTPEKHSVKLFEKVNIDFDGKKFSVTMPSGLLADYMFERGQASQT